MFISTIFTSLFPSLDVFVCLFVCLFASFLLLECTLNVSHYQTLIHFF